MRAMPASALHSDTPAASKHSTIDDVQGFAVGVFLCSLALQVLTTAGLVTGQIAGLAAILAYVTEWSFGPIFFLLNLPFYAFGYRRFGGVFVVKSFLAVTALSILVEVLPLGLAFSHLTPAMAAVTFGTLTGIGILIVFRHGGSLGGLGVVALWVQDRFGVQAGYVQLGFDAVLFAVAALLFPLDIVGWSLLGAVVLNLLIAINHRRDRYVGV